MSAAITIHYESYRDEYGSAFTLGLAIDVGTGQNYVVGFPTSKFTYQKAALVALQYALQTMDPTPEDLTVFTDIKYITEILAKKEDGTFKITPKSNVDLINYIRTKAPNLKVAPADKSIVEVCKHAAKQAGEQSALCWYGLKPCVTLKA